MAVPAGFWRRYVAYFLDWLLVGMVVQTLATLPFAGELGALPAELARLAAAPPADPVALWLGLRPVLVLLGWMALASSVGYALLGGLYFVAMESSAWQATLGKRALGLRVVDAGGARIGRGRATGRFLAAALSWATLNLGHALAAWTADKRALHDLVAGTRVVLDAPGPMPAWARAIIAVHAAALLATVLVLAGLLALVLSALFAALPRY